VVVEGLLVRTLTRQASGVAKGADHNVVRDIEATAVGIGVASTEPGRW